MPGLLSGAGKDSSCVEAMRGWICGCLYCGRSRLETEKLEGTPLEAFKQIFVCLLYSSGRKEQVGGTFE